MQITLDQIETTTKAALVKHGCADWIATHMAHAVRVAEGYGNRICGLYYLESYCQQLQSGRADGTAEPVVSRPRPGTVRVDAANGFAQPAFMRGLDDAITATRENGTASLAITRAHTCTSLGYFTEMVAQKGLIAFGMTNATPIVAAPGGKTRIIGTNPIAFAVPDGQGGVAMQFDQSTTAVALGKITMAKAAGRTIPEGWAVDADGNPTTDPEAALKGSLVSAGGYKGWGLGLMAEILTAGLCGTKLSQDVAPLKAPTGAPHDLGQFYLLIDPGTSEDFTARLTQLQDSITDPGTRLPGQGKSPQDPVDVPEELWAQVETLAG